MSLPLLHAGGSVDGISAALDLRFASSLSLTSTSGITPSFSRASTGTYFNSSGVLTTAAINAPRFNHVYNGSSWVSKGLLIEEQRTNICTYSSNQLNAAWVPFNSTITASGETDPVGGTSAFRIAETTTSNQRHIAYNTITPSASTFTYSVFAKAQERNWLQLISFDDPNLYYTWFNLSTGVVGTNAAGNTATITAVGNGWYRCSVTRTVASTGAQYIQTGPANGDNNSAYAGDPTKGLLIYGAQVELGAFPTSYIPTTAAAVTRSADVCQITGGDFSGFYNQTEGSFAVNYDCPANGTLVQYQANSAVSTNIHTAVSIGTTQYFQVFLPPEQALINAGSIAANVSQSLSSAYKLNDFAASLNGGAVATDTAGSLPTPTKLIIGSDGSIYNNGHIARLRYFNKRLTNTKLRFLSGGPKSFRPDEIVGLQFWVDASDSSTLYTDSALTTLAVSDGDVIGGWKDKSGNSRNALQTDGTKKPVLKLAIQNGRNVVRFDGVNDNMTFSNWQSNPATVFLVVRSSSDTVFLSTLAGASPSYPLFFYYTNGNVYGQNGYVSGFTTANTYNQWTVTCSTTARTIRRDGTAGSGAAGLGGAALYSMIGTYDNSPNYAQNGDTLEILGYNSVLSGSDILLVEAYLKAKWGTP